MNYRNVRTLITIFFVCVPLTTFGAEPKSVCGPRPPQVDDAEVTWFKESDISAAEVLKAIDVLEKARDPSWGGGHHDHLTVGYLKVIKGYTLKYEAENYKTPASVKKFCKWFFTEASWPE